MIATVLAVLDKTEFKAVWEDQMPVVFTGKVRTLRGANAKALELAKRQTQPTTGTTDDKTGTETLLENLLLEEAGLLMSFYEDKGDAVNLAKVSLTAAAVRHLPNQELLSLGITIADLAAALTEGSPAPGADYGISPESVAGLQAACLSFEKHIGQPAGARATRKQLTQKLEQSVDDLMKLLENMDNFIPRFRPRPEGEAFIGAWGNARQVIALGHRFGKKSDPAGATAPNP
ncbi:MAG: hypothetical protein V4726_17345 [Verrucomicrobiota bacterium]